MRVGASQNHSLSASLQALTCLHCPQAVCLSAQAIDDVLVTFEQRVIS